MLECERHGAVACFLACYSAGFSKHEIVLMRVAADIVRDFEVSGVVCRSHKRRSAFAEFDMLAAVGIEFIACVCHPILARTGVCPFVVDTLGHLYAAEHGVVISRIFRLIAAINKEFCKVFICHSTGRVADIRIETDH